MSTELQAERMRLQRSYHSNLNLAVSHDDGCEFDLGTAGWTYDLGFIAEGEWWIAVKDGRCWFDWENIRHSVGITKSMTLEHQLRLLEWKLLSLVKELAP